MLAEKFPPVENTVSNFAHGKVFIPVSMVEPDVDCGIIESTAHTPLVEAGVVTDDSRQAAWMNEQTWATELGPEVTGETSMEELLELRRRFENDKAQHQQSAGYS